MASCALSLIALAWSLGAARIAVAQSTPPPAMQPGPTAPAAGSAVPYWQAPALPATVIHGGAIPAGWSPQAVPYQGIGADGKPITQYFAPTYTFTYPIGPPVPAVPGAAPVPVNRRQAPGYGQPAGYGNGWNYQTQGVAAPAYALPPPTTARYAPQPYQFPAGSPQLNGTSITPPPSMVPAQPLAPPPSQWMPAPASAPAPPPGIGQPLADAATPAIAAAAGAAAASGQSQQPYQIPGSPQEASSALAAASPAAPVPVQPASSSPLQSPASRSANTHLWRVVGVHDGDTVTCLDENNQQQKIRLAEMDAPEVSQDFGSVSREALADMVFGKTIEVRDEGKDRYGRWIGHLSVNGIDVNRQMIATGNAWHYAAYSKDQSLAALQEQAKAQRLGLWAQPNPTPPWEFRATQRAKKAAG
ncbi:MAG: thermonuclease family protein [Planctomycetia bacterium]